jgi:hypothetical protein
MVWQHASCDSSHAGVILRLHRNGASGLSSDTIPAVQITELSTGESQFVLAVVERSLETFERTEVVSRRDGEVNRIMEIRLGGTTSRILFD